MGRRRAAFTRTVCDLLACDEIHWHDHAEQREPGEESIKLRELRGLEFLKPDNPIRRQWEGMWPQSGNVHNWDAIGEVRAEAASSWVLVEAKAHVGELTSSCGATSEGSLRRIQDVFARTRAQLGVTGE